MDSSPPSVLYEWESIGSDDEFTEILCMRDCSGTSEENSLNHVLLPPSNREKNIAEEVAVKGIPECHFENDELLTEMTESKNFLHEQLKLEDKKCKDVIAKDIKHGILRRVAESDSNNHYAGRTFSKEWLEQLKVFFKKYNEDIVKVIQNKNDETHDNKDKNEEILESTNCPDEKLKEDDGIMGPNNCLDEQSEIDDKQFDESFLKKIINKVTESNSKGEKAGRVESEDCYCKQSKVDDTEKDEIIVKDNTEEVVNKVTGDDNAEIVEFEDCYDKRTATDDKKYDSSIVKDIAGEVINNVIESGGESNGNIRAMQKRISSTCEDVCSGKKPKYNAETTTTVLKIETENERRPTPTLSSALETSEKCVWIGNIYFKGSSIPTLGYCIRGDREFAARIMSTIDSMAIVLKNDCYIAKKKIWERFKDSSRFTTVLGVHMGEEESEAIKDFNKCLASEEKCFYRVFSIRGAPKVLRNVYIFKIDLKTKTFIRQIKPNCKLICTKRSYFLMIFGYAWKHEAQRYLHKLN